MGVTSMDIFAPAASLTSDQQSGVLDSVYGSQMQDFGQSGAVIPSGYGQQQYVTPYQPSSVGQYQQPIGAYGGQYQQPMGGQYQQPIGGLDGQYQGLAGQYQNAAMLGQTQGLGLGAQYQGLGGQYQSPYSRMGSQFQQPIGVGGQYQQGYGYASQAQNPYCK